MFQDAFQDVLVYVEIPKKTSIYRSLGVGELHVAESDRRIFKTFFQNT